MSKDLKIKVGSTVLAVVMGLAAYNIHAQTTTGNGAVNAANGNGTNNSQSYVGAAGRGSGFTTSHNAPSGMSRVGAVTTGLVSGGGTGTSGTTGTTGSTGTTGTTGTH